MDNIRQECTRIDKYRQVWTILDNNVQELTRMINKDKNRQEWTGMDKHWQGLKAHGLAINVLKSCV